MKTATRNSGTGDFGKAAGRFHVGKDHSFHSTDNFGTVARGNVFRLIKLFVSDKGKNAMY
jgi:hypothetical protein